MNCPHDGHECSLPKQIHITDVIGDSGYLYDVCTECPLYKNQISDLITPPKTSKEPPPPKIDKSEAEKVSPLLPMSLALLKMFGYNFKDIPAQTESTTPQKTCSNCGISLSEVLTKGRAGCATCYSDFYEDMKITISNCQYGNLRHIGKVPEPPKIEVPKKIVEEETAEQKLESMKKQLDQAITREDYETAARLRDQIRNLG